MEYLWARGLTWYTCAFGRRWFRFKSGRAHSCSVLSHHNSLRHCQRLFLPKGCTKQYGVTEKVADVTAFHDGDTALMRFSRGLLSPFMPIYGIGRHQSQIHHNDPDVMNPEDTWNHDMDRGTYSSSLTPSSVSYGPTTVFTSSNRSRFETISWYQNNWRRKFPLQSLWNLAQNTMLAMWKCTYKFQQFPVTVCMDGRTLDPKCTYWCIISDTILGSFPRKAIP